MSAAKRKREADAMKDITGAADEKKPKVAMAGGSSFVNRQRVLVFSSRGITTRYRHLLDDFRKLLPHHKRDVKLDAKDTLHVVNQIAEIKGCNTTIFLEARKRQDLYMWVSRVGVGPSVKFLVQNGACCAVCVCVHVTSEWGTGTERYWCRLSLYLDSPHDGRAQDDGQRARRLAAAADVRQGV